MSDLVLFWHRNDLRITDNIGLAQACATSDSPGERLRQRVVSVFCFDRQILSHDNVAPIRVAYMLGCLAELERDYQQAGGKLLFIEGDPADRIPQLAQALNVRAVYWNLDVEPYSQIRDDRVATALCSHQIASFTHWDRQLHDPTTIKSGSNQPYTVYTPYWRNWIARDKPEPAIVNIPPTTLTEAETQALQQLPTIELPTAADLGIPDWNEPLVFAPGTAAAQARLDLFIDRSIAEYAEQRNFPAIIGTSGLSCALKFGAIGIRSVWAATITATEQTRSDEARLGITTWQQELAWREFYQQAMYHFPSLAEGSYREPLKHFPWQNNEDYFQAWCRGETGYPIVDAAMRQLNEIGWMHNRCRMIVASFLTKDLIINWQWGEKYFMQRLIDGDLSANNGGWQWSASSGMDPKPLRIFNPYTQAQKFDPEGEYIRQWVPELRSLDTDVLLTGKIEPLTRNMLGYPQPIVDHNRQQRLFKDLYASIKTA